jgi:hypothetical protein
MEKNLIFLKPLSDEVGNLLERLSIDNEYEVFEIDDILELSQTLPILEQSFILNGDLKVTRQYLGELKQYTTNMDCFVLLVNDKEMPPHISNSLKAMGLNEIVSSKLSSEDLLKKIDSFFEEGYQGPDQELRGSSDSFSQKKWKKSVDNNEEWKIQHTLKQANDNNVKKLKSLSSNISTIEKNRIERLLSELKADEKIATLTKLKIGDLKLEFNSKQVDSQELQAKLIGRKLDPYQEQEITTIKDDQFKSSFTSDKKNVTELVLKTSESPSPELELTQESSIEDELEQQMSPEKALDEMGLEVSRKVFEENTIDHNESQESVKPFYSEDQTAQVLERFNSYEKKDSERTSKEKFEEISYKRREGTADFYDAIKDDEEGQRESFVVKEHLNQNNPFLNSLGEDIPLDLIELESKKEAQIVFPVKNDFLYMIGLSTVIGNTIPHHQKVLMYINFVLNRKFEGIYVPFVLKDSKRKVLFSAWDIEAFKSNFGDCSSLIDENMFALEQYSIPHFDVYNDWGIFVYPYFWEREKCGIGLMLTKKPLSEDDKKFIELNMLCARNIIFEESLKC